MSEVIVDGICATIVLVDIRDIQPADTILHEGKLRTVCRNNIGTDTFMGRTLFGDSYKSGHKKVSKAINLRDARK